MMKREILIILALCACLAIGFAAGFRHAATKDVSPEVRRFLKLWFGKENIHLVTDEEAQSGIEMLAEYADFQIHDASLPWAVYAFCKLNELDSTPPAQPADEYTEELLTQFFRDYRSGNHQKGLGKFFDKLHADLTSDTNRFDWRSFEHPPGHVR